MAHFTWPWAQTAALYLETRLKSECFDTLDDLLLFQVQML